MGFKIMMTLIFWSCILIIYIMYFNETKVKKNIILGTVIPFAHQNDEQVLHIVSQYKKWSTIVFGLLTLTIVPSVFVSSTANLFYILTWLSFAMIIMTVPYVQANKSLRKYKLENDLKPKAEMHTDFKLSAIDIKTHSPYYSLIPFAVSLIPTIYLLIKQPNQLFDFLITSITISATILLCMVLHIIVNRRKKDVAGNNTDINYALSFIRARNWARMFIGMNFLLAGLSILFLFSVISNGQFDSFVTFGVLFFSFGSVLFAMYIEFDTRKKQQEFTKINTDAAEMIVDEDDYWLLGMFYYNKNDRRIMIPDRVGSNTTVNMARPIGKVLMAISVICIVGLPFLGGYFYEVDKIPMKVQFSDTEIVATHRKIEYDIKMEDVESIERTKECPQILSKVSGWATENVEKGTFSVKDLGVCEVFVSADDKQFAIVKTKDGTTYIFGY